MWVIRKNLSARLSRQADTAPGTRDVAQHDQRAAKAVDQRYARIPHVQSATVMRQLLLILSLAALGACSSPLPNVDPQQAWVDLATPTPGGKLVMAERLDNQRLKDGRYFQVSPGSHELMVRFDFEVFSGGMGMNNDPQERLCYLTLRYDHFQAGQRYRLEARNLAFTPSARLYDAKGEIVAEERMINCVP